MRTARNRRFFSVGFAALLTLTGLSLARPAVAADRYGQSISIDWPTTMLAGSPAVDLTGAASNSTSTPFDGRYEVVFENVDGFSATEVHVSYEAPFGSGNYVSIPLTAVTLVNGGELIGTTESLTLPAQTTVGVHFRMSFDTDVPSRTITPVIELIRQPNQSVAYSYQVLSLTSPLAVEAAWPNSFVADNSSTEFTATITNSAQVAIDGLRLDAEFPYPNGTRASHLQLGYESPTGSGTYLPVALGGTSDLTGVIGDPTGFSLAAGASMSVKLRLIFGVDFPGNFYSGAHLLLDQVDQAAPHGVRRALVSDHGAFMVTNPAPTLDSSWAFTRYGQLVTVSGTAVAGANIDIYFARRGQTTYVSARNVTAGANGRFSATYAASDDLTYYASNQGTKSNLVLTQLAPTVAGPQWRSVKRNTVTAVSGTGAPKTSITVHFRRPTDPVSRYPVARAVAVAANGHWSYAYTVSNDLAYYVTSNANQIGTMIYQVHYAR